MHSPAAWTPEQLRHSFGGAYAEAFDFSALGKVIKTAACRNPLPERRRTRIAVLFHQLAHRRVRGEQAQGFRQ